MKNLNFRKCILALAALMMVVSLLAYPVVKPETTEGGALGWLQSSVGADAAHAQVRVFYVAPYGKSTNDGSISSPWDLQTALNQPSSAGPGSIFYLRGGEYYGAYVSKLNGTATLWYVLKAYNGERAILENNRSAPALDIAGSSYTIFMDLEITSLYAVRATHVSAYGARVNQGTQSHHVKFINMIIHDVEAQGLAWWQALTDSEIYGSLFYYNGVTKLDHGVYAHNVSGTKRFIDNIVFDNASHGFHGYAETTDKGLNNFWIEGNTFFNNGSIGGTYKRNILVGGLIPANNDTIIRNYTYYPGSSGEALNLGYSGGSTNSTVMYNYLVGGAVVLGGGYSGLTFTGNTIYPWGGLSGFSQSTFGGNWWGGSGRPPVPVIFVRPNQYENFRANITIYNWPGSSAVWVPASSLSGIAIAQGKRYELHNVQNYFGDIVSGVYDGSGISIPMTNHSVAQPFGLSSKPASTFPAFGTFVLIVR